jgi:hypothetical protein
MGCTAHPTKRFGYRDNAMRYARFLHDPIWSRLLEREIQYAHARGLPHVPHGGCAGRVRSREDEHMFGTENPHD